MTFGRMQNLAALTRCVALRPRFHVLQQFLRLLLDYIRSYRVVHKTTCQIVHTDISMKYRLIKNILPTPSAAYV